MTSPDTAGELERRAAEAYREGRLEEAVTAWEELYALRLASGEDEEAAWWAAMVAVNLIVETGMMAPVRAWARRAERLVEGHEPGRVHALLAMVRTYERLLSGDPDAAWEHAVRSRDLGAAHGVGMARGLGQVALARLQIHRGDLDGGFELLDEVAVGLAAGEYDALTTGNLYCELICAAQWVFLLDRARQWTEVMERWRHGPAYGAVHGRCRVHRAELLRLSGPADRAEEEALGACNDLRPWMRRELGWPLMELGNIRLRRGDLIGAEQAFLDAHERAWSPYPGLALLRLEQGEVDTALALIADAIEHPWDVPWKERPPFGDLWLAPLLEAQARIGHVAADRNTTRGAADRLRGIADAYPTASLLAMADLADGRAALLEGDTTTAIDACGRAVAGWVDLGAPYEAGLARLVLGEARAQAGSPSSAREEWTAARAAFASFGADIWARRAADLVAGPPSGSAPPAAARAVFRLDGDHRLVCFREVEVTMVDLKGFRYLERMLAEPGREFHALDLVAGERGADPAPAHPDADADLGHDDGAGLPVIDEQARAAYRRRLAEVEDDIDEAVRMNDPGRRALAERDRDFLLAELHRAVGLGGRDRTTGGTAERARTSVTRSLRYAIGRLSEHHPELGAHLGRCVRTGAFCGYQPDPLVPVVWELH